MANLVICCDGTWNNPQQEDNGAPAPTNVVKLYHALAKKDNSEVIQKLYYHPGLGGEETGLKDSIIDGALGKSIKRHICSAYHWLASNYNEGDKVFIFGFSRGAFTARSLGGLLGLGLLDFNKLENNKARWEKTHGHFENYKSKLERIPKSLYINNKKSLPIHFIGVWETVGALGIPNDMELFNLLDNPASWRFHDTSLGKHISIARHAMAMDEKRSSFCVTRWSENLVDRDVKEMWFPGVHSDVGGGYYDTDLSDIALEWMIKEAQESGLFFRDNILNQLNPNPCGVLHNSFKGIFAKFRSRPRNVDCVITANNENFHESVFKRQEISPIEHPEYWPTIKLEVGESTVVNVFAKQHWTPTYIYMNKGERYIFDSEGEWQDSKDECDWLGTEDGKLTAGDIIRFASSILGMTERKFKQATQNRSTDFWGTKRVEHMRWFIAVGCIANDSGKAQAVTNDGSPHPHQYEALSHYQKNSKTLQISSSGYFYAFPNDVWSLYHNNQGCIQLRVTRKS
ncbi:DUF2235 domain-containing protein [Pseudoalteromonas fuliginea]|uniref:DUF2235 domain-containing protein n=1 Tax=Pseudoalteromonas TaxID=53246 RepID=UPI0002AA94A8|nr:DUF2235 domain-containing protein [Pseudoalteromonas sp. Bsw20308]ALQ07610.1 hypothetical protein D172_005685 [Pseudoalteromonas sp. Bsw20308]